MAGRWYALETEHREWLAVRAYSAEDAVRQLACLRGRAHVITIEPIDSPLDITSEHWHTRLKAIA